MIQWLPSGKFLIKLWFFLTALWVVLVLAWVTPKGFEVEFDIYTMHLRLQEVRGLKLIRGIVAPPIALAVFFAVFSKENWLSKRPKV